ncbi:hypothetical protein ACFL4N_05085 [Thermodesulfobacteriota bacterium]
MGFIPDLEKADWWHEVGFAYSKSIPESFSAIMIGWLGNTIPSSGEIPGEFLKRLEWAYEHRAIDEGWLGEHECEICNSCADSGEILIVDGHKMYVAPKMILHYVKDHSYLPPEEFMEAVEKMKVM